MNIVSVYNTRGAGRGHFPYTPDHIESLKNQLGRLGHELAVIGHDLTLFHVENFSGWWSKAVIFAPEYKNLRPMLALDLDTIVVRSLDPILELDPSRLWLIRQFLSKTHLAEMGLCTVPDSEVSDRIWQACVRADKSRQPGEIVRRFPHDFIPDVVDGIYSYKKHCTVDSYPEDARVICYHGKPKPPDVEGWALEWWQDSLN